MLVEPDEVETDVELFVIPVPFCVSVLLVETVEPTEPFWAGVEPVAPLPVLLLPDAVDWAFTLKPVALNTKAHTTIIFFIVDKLGASSTQTCEVHQFWLPIRYK